MGKVQTLQSSLNGGELTPKLMGRPELPRYQSGLELCENFIPFVLGGATVRPGTRRVAQALDPAGGYALDVYTSLDDAGVFRGFCLESNPAQVRAFKGSSIADTFANVNPVGLASKQVAQFEDYLYTVSALVPPTRAKRQADADWIIEAVPFTAQPMMRPPNTKDITLTPSAIDGDITLEASADLFVAGHVGVKFQVNGGIVQVTAVTSPTVAEATVIQRIVPPEGLFSSNTTLTIHYTPPMVEGAFVGTAFDVDCSIDANFFSKILDVTVPEVLPDGVLIETGVTDTYLDGTETDSDWKEEAWSELRGYPVAVTFYEERMILAGSRTYPTTVWGSKSGQPLDFTLSTDDNGGLALTLACADTPIRSIIATDAIYILTANREISLDTGNEKPLSPTNFRIKKKTAKGASFMTPVVSGSDLIWSSVSLNRLYSLVYRLETNRFVANDITLYGEHLVTLGGGIAEVAVTREPHPVLWCRTVAGGIITLTYDSEQQVAAWARQPLDGTVTRILSVPDEAGNDVVWIAIERNGQTNIEVFDWSLQTDSAVTGSDPVGKATWDGLDHLEGKAVVAVADGYAVQNLTVENGEVTLPFVAKTVEIGLQFNARLKDLPLGIAGSGATISQQASLNEIKVLLHQSKGCKVSGERVPFQRFDGELLDQPVSAFTGWKKVGALGWGDFGSGGQVEIIRDLPLPCTVLAIVKEVTING